MKSFPDEFRDYLAANDIVPLIGVYDAFSAKLTSRHFPAVFCSGYGFTASFYGLPDEGFLTWVDVIDYTARLRALLPKTHLVMDMDDGFGNAKAAQICAERILRAGGSAVILEDQRRPKKCGHLSGKEVIPLPEYLEKFRAVRDTGIFTVARSDAEEASEALRRAEAFAEHGAEAILVDGLADLEMISKIRGAIGPRPRLTVNLIAGGKTPPLSLRELAKLGVNIVNYSTPCLFAAQAAMEEALREMASNDCVFPAGQKHVFTKNRELLGFDS